MQAVSFFPENPQLFVLPHISYEPVGFVEFPQSHMQFQTAPLPFFNGEL
jgi:hypothetical protein